jgi:hypothetical protein
MRIAPIISNTLPDILAHMVLRQSTDQSGAGVGTGVAIRDIIPAGIMCPIAGRYGSVLTVGKHKPLAETKTLDALKIDAPQFGREG